MQRRTCRPIVLKRVERRLAVSIERHYLSIDHSFIGHRRQRLHHAGIPYVEVVVVLGAELDLAPALHCQGAVAVELISYWRSGPSGNFSVRSRSIGSMKRTRPV